MNRLNSNQLDMRYASPDFMRPNPELLQKTKRNFSWNKFRTKQTRPPSPNLLPMSPVKWQKQKIMHVLMSHSMVDSIPSESILVMVSLESRNCIN